MDRKGEKKKKSTSRCVVIIEAICSLGSEQCGGCRGSVAGVIFRCWGINTFNPGSFASRLLADWVTKCHFYADREMGVNWEPNKGVVLKITW